MADQGDVENITEKINGGLNGYGRALAAVDVAYCEIDRASSVFARALLGPGLRIGVAVMLRATYPV